MSGNLVVERVRTTEGLQALRPEWEALLAHCPGHSLTVTPLWMGTWWEIFGNGRELCLLTARTPDGRLVGIAPLQIRPVRHRGMLAFRRLEFLATGEPQADFIGSDYLDLVVHRDRAGEATGALARYVFSELGTEWDEALLQHFSGESPSLPALADAAASLGLKVAEGERRTGVFITLPESWEEMLRRLSGDRRKQLLRRRRRLAEAGKVEFDWETTPENFPERWEIVRDLHQRRWASLGRPGCFSSDRFSRFHRRVAEALLPGGGIRIAVLRLEGRPIACDYYYVHDDRVYAYQAGLDPEEGLRYSAGTVGIGYGIEAAIGSGLREYDFLKNVHPYKAEWSPERRDQVTLRVAHVTARERLRELVETGIRQTRPLRRRVSAVLSRGGEQA